MRRRALICRYADREEYFLAIDIWQDSDAPFGALPGQPTGVSLEPIRGETRKKSCQRDGTGKLLPMDNERTGNCFTRC